jgi:hypothetical protein
MIKLAACIGFVFATRPLRGQNDAPAPGGLPDRSPTTAAWLGAFVPGAGHVYAGENLRGAGLFFAAAGGIAEGIYLYNTDPCTYSPLLACDTTSGRRGRHFAAAEVIAVGGIAWVISAIDAPRAVHRRLERQRLRTAQIEWTPKLGLMTGQPARFAIALQGTW